MSIPVLYDACVLYGNEVRDLLMRIAISGMVRAHWTDEILDETFGNLIANRPDLSPERLAVTRERMNAAVPGALVGGYETLVEALKLPDPDDRHVLAAAITAGAVVIVTSNLNDFPAETLQPFGIEAKTPDDFVLDQISLDEGSVRDCVHQIARGRTRPPKTYEAVLNALERARPSRFRDGIAGLIRGTPRAPSRHSADKWQHGIRARGARRPRRTGRSARDHADYSQNS